MQCIIIIIIINTRAGTTFTAYPRTKLVNTHLSRISQRLSATYPTQAPRNLSLPSPSILPTFPIFPLSPRVSHPSGCPLIAVSTTAFIEKLSHVCSFRAVMCHLMPYLPNEILSHRRSSAAENESLPEGWERVFGGFEERVNCFDRVAICGLQIGRAGQGVVDDLMDQ